MSLPFVGAEQIAALLPMADAIDVLEETFSSNPRAPARQHVPVDGGEMLLMPASSGAGAGVKLVTVAPGNPTRGLPLIHGVYVLFAPESLKPVALLDGGGLTRLRTAAVSGLATRHLARADAQTLVVFGGGVQGTAHIEAMRAVRPIADVVVIERGDTNHGVVATADIICTCTTSPVPVFDGSLLSPGTHVNAIGAYQPTTRELDDAAIASGRVIVETKDAALDEAGDLAVPIAAGIISETDIEQLADVVTGAPGRADEEITIFKSVGVAFEDLAVAAAVVARLGS